MIAASLTSPTSAVTERASAISRSALVRATTSASGRFAIAAGGPLARRMDLRVCAIAQHVLVGLHRGIGERLTAILRYHPAPRDRRGEQRPEQGTAQHPPIL